MNRLILIALYLIAPLAALAQTSPKVMDIPTITTMLETESGARISIQYRATFYGDPDSSSRVKSATDMKSHVDKRMGVMRTNVQLQLGKYRIDPGSYYIGFTAPDDGDWTFVLGDAGGDYVRLPVPVLQQEVYVPYLSFVMTPGITSQDFVMNTIFGMANCSLRWVISGVVADSSDSFSSQSMLNGLQSTVPDAASAGVVSASAGPVREATQFPASGGNAVFRPTPPPRAGSGVFRRYYPVFQGSQKP
ncbi:MAG: hypothetical protein GC154_09625 [bacterium]|nr:hypothetical protein [bacterium]